MTMRDLPKVTITYFPQSDNYTLAVGHRIMIDGDTFAVCDGVREELEGRSCGVGELREVADSIRAAWERDPW